jgi:uncharacterized BrkB/YihY/UPF0761 family membrane protein
VVTTASNNVTLEAWVRWDGGPSGQIVAYNGDTSTRGYGLYLANFASFEGPSGDANVGAAVLLILWIHYTAVVFLLGGVVADTWELRKMQQRQRARLA